MATVLEGTEREKSKVVLDDSLYDPRQKQVEVYRDPKTIEVLDTNDVLTGGDVLPGFRLPIEELFKGLVKPAPRSHE